MAEQRSKRILVVDDEPIVCRTICDLLQLDGHDVQTVSTAGDAIELCKVHNYDLIFLDFYLPEMTGEQVLTIIRRSNPRQKVVVISGQKPFPAVGQADFLVRKPFTAEIIRNAVARFA